MKQSPEYSVWCPMFTSSPSCASAKIRKNDLVLREINVMVEASRTSLENFKHSRGFIPLELLEVTAKAIKNGKGKKITVFTYKPKKNAKRKMGHRQPYTKVEIAAINA